MIHLCSIHMSGMLPSNIYMVAPPYPLRSEQDKEPEQESVSEVVGPGPSEESGTDGMKFT